MPGKLYANEIRVTRKKEEQWLVTIQRAIERSMLEILLREHIQIEVIQKWSRVKDMITEYQKQKFHWAGHVTMFTDNRWSHAVVERYLRDQKWSLGRAPQQWKDEIVKQLEPIWSRRVRPKTKWKCIVASNEENIRKLANKKTSILHEEVVINRILWIFFRFNISVCQK